MMLAAAIWLAVAPSEIVREAAGALSLQQDAELDEAAECLLLGYVAGDRLTIPALRRCAQTAGVYDNLLLPVLASHRGARGVIEQLTPFFKNEGRARGITHFGAAVVVHDGWLRIAVLSTLRRAELHIDPIPRRPGDLLMFSGSLGLNHNGARAFLSSPRGLVSQVPVHIVTTDRRVFQGSVQIPNESGQYQLEIVGDTDSGPIVVANRALFVGRHPGPAAAHEEAPYGETEQERVWALMNAARARAGLPPFVFDRELNRIAQKHASYMRDRRSFAHETDETNTIMRLRDAHIVFSEAAENIAESASIEDAHESLMASPGHRASIMSPVFRKVGVGVARCHLVTGDPCVYVVVDFTAP